MYSILNKNNVWKEILFLTIEEKALQDLLRYVFGTYDTEWPNYFAFDRFSGIAAKLTLALAENNERLKPTSYGFYLLLSRS